MKDRMAELQEKLDNCEERLRLREKDYQHGGDGRPESPTMRQSSFPCPSPVDALATPVDGTVSSTSGMTTTECVQQESFEFCNYFLAEKCDTSNGIENDSEQNLSPQAIGYNEDKESPGSGSCGADGT